MSKFLSNDETKKTDSKKVIFDYYNTKIYFNQYGQTPDNGGYVDITFSTPENIVNPNIIYISGGPTIKYKSSKLFVYKKTHLIDDLDFHGEIVIENIPITNNNNDKIYICIPLKTNASIKSTGIDKMIKMADRINRKKIKMNINLNDKINKKNPYFYYENGRDKVVVLNTAIEVNTSFENFKTCDLFPNYDENYLILQNITDGFANVVEGFQEGNTTIQTCTPIDENDKDVSNGLIVNYLNGNLTSQNKTIDLLFSLIIFVIISLLSLFVSPHLYKNVFITTLNDNDLNQTALFCFFYLLLACSLLFGGIFYDYPSAVTGLILLFFFAMSFIFIYNKGNSDSTYLEGATWINKIASMKFLKTIAAAWENIPKLFINELNTHSILIPVGIIITTILFGIFAYSNTNKVNKGKMKNKKFPEKKGTFGKDNSAYKNYVYIMLSIFGYVYSGLVVGPFYYYYAVNLPPPTTS
jgi:hypothetical protein